MARKSIYFNEFSEKFVAKRTAQGKTPNYSANVNAAFEMLAHLAQSSTPTLSTEEWKEVYNIYAKKDLTRPVLLPLNLAKDLLDHYGATLPRDLPDNCVRLVERLADMNQAEQFSVLDNVRIFWANVNYI